LIDGVGLVGWDGWGGGGSRRVDSRLEGSRADYR
jgi:hypothetical protein